MIIRKKLFSIRRKLLIMMAPILSHLLTKIVIMALKLNELNDQAIISKMNDQPILILSKNDQISNTTKIDNMMILTKLTLLKAATRLRNSMNVQLLNITKTGKMKM